MDSREINNEYEIYNQEGTLIRTIKGYRVGWEGDTTYIYEWKNMRDEIVAKISINHTCIKKVVEEIRTLTEEIEQNRYWEQIGQQCTVNTYNFWPSLKEKLKREFRLEKRE